MNTPIWDELKFSGAFRAATGLNTSAIHATIYRDLMEAPDCKKTMTSKAQYAHLITYIRNSSQVGNEGHVKLIPTDAN